VSRAVEAEFARGCAAHRQGRLGEAESAYRRVLAQQPGHAGALRNLGVLALQTGHAGPALELFDGALSQAPRDAALHGHRGDALLALGRLPEAISALREATRLDAGNAVLWNSLGIAEERHGQLTAACEAWRRALDVLEKGGAIGTLAGEAGDPRASLAAICWNNLGNASLKAGVVDEAIECHHRALALAPGHAVIHSNLLRDLSHVDDRSPEALLAAHRRFWDRYATGPQPDLRRVDRHADRRLRIGWVSADFRDHAVARFLLPLLRHLDRGEFESVLYGALSRPDAVTQQMAALASGLRQTLGVTDQGLARQVREDRIDILIDLSGHTGDNRLPVFALKPAPLQLSWLGYPMTTGAPSTLIDYRISDAIADPPGLTDAHASERLWRLPACNWCYEPPLAPEVDETPPLLRRPQAEFTFASFNAIAKLSPTGLALWAQVLAAVPRSRLLLKSFALADAGARAALTRRFVALGIDEERLVLMAPQADTAAHLAQYRHVDLALDTLPYNGTTTTCEALWMGVPVLTMAGVEHRARVGASLLTHAGLPDMVAPDAAAFVAMAVTLARDPQRLAALRHGLRQRLQSSRLMDGPRFAEDFGAALRAMWRQRWERHQS
jgi:tetratricopeptide (TPR) repeat protein